MIEKIELRKTSLEFRRVSSNLLKSTTETADVNLERFKKFIDKNEIINVIINEKVANTDFDYQSCFVFESGYERQIIVPVDESDHIKAMYDYLNFIIESKSSVLSISLGYYNSSRKYDDYIQSFLDKAFKSLIDFVNDSITNEMIMLDDGGAPMQNITQNFNGTNYGTTNVGNNISSVNNVSVGESDKLIELLQQAINLVKSVEVNDEEFVEFADDLDVLHEQIQSDAPKKSRVKKALANIQVFAGKLTSQLYDEASNKVLESFNWDTLIETVRSFIEKIG